MRRLLLPRIADMRGTGRILQERDHGVRKLLRLIRHHQVFS